HFQKYEFIPLVLHTLPETREMLAETLEGAPITNPPSSSHTVSTVPRLISVVKIIKRQYLKKLELKYSSTFLGLHQYNEVGTLQELG
ncbi:hypothetical protein FB451DRAFT_954104, partial [Mycena latifolia]